MLVFIWHDFFFFLIYWPHQHKAAPAPSANVRTQYDRLALFKHSEVYPSAEELEQVQTVISHVECALKSVSQYVGIPHDAAVAAEDAVQNDENTLIDAASKVGATSADDAVPKDSEVPKMGEEKSVQGRWAKMKLLLLFTLN